MPILGIDTRNFDPNVVSRDQIDEIDPGSPSSRLKAKNGSRFELSVGPPKKESLQIFT